MHPSAPLNSTLENDHPAAAACLSALGRRMFFPMGIPAQAAEAKSATINATIGQLTDGRGGSIPLPAIAEHLTNISLNAATLYTAQGGSQALRDAWGARLRTHGDGPMTSPFCTVGLTHGLSLLADLFVDEDTDVLLPSPGWGNYDHIFGVRGGGRIHRYPVFEGGEFAKDAVKKTLEQVQTKGVLLLNFPGNPTGYTPTPEELSPWLEAIRDCSKPIVVICDDAYAGFVYEAGHISRSPFHALADADPSTVLTVKVDGATKELCFFGGRVGFVTFGASGAAGRALDTKIKGMARATVSTGPAISQALVLSALQSPSLGEQQQAQFQLSQNRYHTLKRCLAAAQIYTIPFNSGFFALIPVKGDPEALRTRLLAKGVGVVAFPQHSAIRVAFSSTADEDLETLVTAIATEIRGQP
jgi:aspartate/methionine/tyrosine aminotransferase